MASVEIKKYDVAYYAGGKNTSGYTYRAIVGLRKDDGSIIGTAYFHRSPATLPDSDSQNAAGQVFCHYLAEDFPRVLDLLRNEKPVYVNFTAGSWNIARIETSLEAIGEGEPV